MLLLDTNAIIYLAFEQPMQSASRQATVAAAQRGEILVSSASAWEIGLLVRKGRLELTQPAPAWFATFASRPGVQTIPLSAAAAILSSFLPEPFHGDPADRMLVATARELGATFVTRDTKILDYAAAGHLRAIAC